MPNMQKIVQDEHTACQRAIERKQHRLTLLTALLEGDADKLYSHIAARFGELENTMPHERTATETWEMDLLEDLNTEFEIERTQEEGGVL